VRFWQNVFDFAAERKDIPREHEHASDLFSHRKQCEHLAQLVARMRVLVWEASGQKPHYSEDCKKFLQYFAKRYLDTLKGKTGDSFAEVVGHHVFVKHVILFVETTDPTSMFDETREVWREIMHELIKTREDSEDDIPTMVKSIVDAKLRSEATAFITDVLNLATSSDQALAPAYLNRARKIGMEIVKTIPSFMTDNLDLVIRWLDKLAPALPQLDPPAPPGQEPGVSEASEKIRDLVEHVSSYLPVQRTGSPITEAAKTLIRKYFSQYMKQPKKWEAGYSSEQTVAHYIVTHFVTNESKWVVEVLGANVVSQIAHFLILEDVNGRTGSTVAIGSLADELKGGEFEKFVSDVIHLRLSEGPKSKKYIELSFDIAREIISAHPTFVLARTDDAFGFLNWAISFYLLEPDVADLNDVIKDVLVSGLVPDVASEGEISKLVRFIDDLIDLKHQALVLPQQTLPPLQSLPQYSHVSHGFALNMVQTFGAKFSIAQETQSVWRDDFVQLLDKLSNLPNNPEIRLQAWLVPTVQSR